MYAQRDQSKRTFKAAIPRMFHSSPQNVNPQFVVYPSAPQSECSTLVNFAIDPIDQDASDSATVENDNDSLIDVANCAWLPYTTVHKKAPAPPRPTRADRAWTNVNPSQDPLEDSEQMLAYEDRAWGSPPSKQSAAKPKHGARKFTLFTAKPAAPASHGVAQLIDAEDRAWM